MRVGIVGTGEMGRPLVDRLLGAGLEVTALTRRAEVRGDLEASGVRCVDSPEALAAGQDVVVVYVFSDAQVRELALDGGLADAMAPGAVLLVLTTGSPRTVEAIAERGIAVVDAPGSGGPAQVADGTLTLFVGGAEAHVARCRPVFESYATKIVHFGAVGAGQRVKLLNNLLFGAHVELAVQAAAISEAFGIDPKRLAETLHGCSGTSYGLDLLATMGSAEMLVAGAGRFVHKDVRVARELAADLGAELGTLAPVTDAVLERTRGG